MELTEFYSKLYALGYDWIPLTRLSHSIKRQDEGEAVMCPITAVAFSETGTSYHVWKWAEAARAIGLDSDQAQAIVNAADHNIINMDEEIRKQLLKATDLEEWDAAWQRGETG